MTCTNGPEPVASETQTTGKDRRTNASMTAMSTLESWRISKRTAVLLFLTPFAGLLLIGAAHFLSEETWRKIDEEDGPIESLQFAGLFISSLISLGVSYRLLRIRRKFSAVLFALLGLGLFFIAGEEIAWGQRIFQFQTPESLAEVNEKQELSVHNVGSLSELFNVGKFFAGLYGAAGCWILSWLSRKRDVQQFEIFVVPWFLSSAFLVILMQRILRWTVLQNSVPRVMENLMSRASSSASRLASS